LSAGRDKPLAQPISKEEMVATKTTFLTWQEKVATSSTAQARGSYLDASCFEQIDRARLDFSWACSCQSLIYYRTGEHPSIFFLSNQLGCK